MNGFFEVAAKAAESASEVTKNEAGQAEKKFDPDKRVDVDKIKKEEPKEKVFDPDKRIDANQESPLRHGENSPESVTETEKISDKPRYIITRNESLEGDRHPITGVPFEKKIVELPSGEKIEGVFPIFKSLFDAQIPKEKYYDSDASQFKECNKQLWNAIQNNPELKSRFSETQLEQIKDGITDGTAPDGFVWNHNEEPGKIQLVDFDPHAKTGHTGGRALWGGGSIYR